MRGRTAAAAVAVSLAVACGTGESGTGAAPEPDGGMVELDLGSPSLTTSPTSRAKPLTSAPVSPLPAGTYRTTVGPEVTFTVDDRWDLEAMDPVQGALLFGSYAPMDIVAPRVEWIDLTAAGARVVPPQLRGVVGSVGSDEFEQWSPLPDDLAAWFASDSGLNVGPIEQVMVGGRPASSFTFTVPTLPPGTNACVLWPCRRLLGGADWGWPALEGDRGRMWIVDLDGHQLLLQVRSQPTDADLVVPAGLEVVASMTIGASA